MSAIRGKDTRIEVTVRKALFAMGFRYRLHDRRLPGKPDLVFPRYGAVVFVHGCYWHGHGCDLFRLPSTNVQFWKDKIRANQVRDEGAVSALAASGWRVGVVWECALRGRRKLGVLDVAGRLGEWLAGKNGHEKIVIAGSPGHADLP